MRRERVRVYPARMFALLEGWRHVKVTDHTAIDYSHVLKDLADIHFPRVVDHGLRGRISIRDRVGMPVIRYARCEPFSL